MGLTDLVKGEEIYYINKGDNKQMFGIFEKYSKKGEDHLDVGNGNVWAYWKGSNRLGWMPVGEVFRVHPKKVEYNEDEWV